MSDPIELTTSSMQGLVQQYRTIACNIANAGTIGYKRRRGLFAQSLRNQEAAGGVWEAAPYSPSAKLTVSDAVDFSQGRMVNTARPLDLALDGKGFFVIETPQGELYTRNGAFRVSPEGQILDFAGRTIAGSAGPIVVPAGASTVDIQVSRNGQISAGGRRIGELKLVDFEDPTALIPVGAGTFQAPSSVRPIDPAKVTVHQGFQEASNVRITEEMVDLITVARLYEANVRIIRAEDERMKNLLQVAMA